MRHSKGCNCQHLFKKEALKLRVNHYFCYKCGNLLLKDSEGNIHHTLKSKQNKVHYDLSPITIIKNMKKKTEDEYPFIYQEFNFNKSLRNQTYNTFNKMQKRDNSMNQTKINSKNKKINFNSKSSEHSKKILSHKRPFISATCGYGKYFDEPLQKGGESKLN